MNQYTVFLSFKSNRTFFEYVYRIIFWMKKKSHNLRTNFWNLRTNFWNFRPLCVGEISCVNSLMIGSTFKSSDIWGQTILSHKNRSRVWLKASICLIEKENIFSLLIIVFSWHPVPIDGRLCIKNITINDYFHTRM